MPQQSKRELNTDNRQFVFAVTPKFSMDGTGDAGGQPRQRKFSGVAYSGEIIPGHWYWGDVIFDLSTMSMPDKLPALIDHDRGQRCGYSTTSSITNEAGLTVAGVLLSNDHGKSVAQDSDEGFPWQMSVHIEPGSIEEVQSGTDVTVNGKPLKGPVTVFKNSKIIEVSFTATGWDSNTSATAMGRGGNTNPEKEDAMDLKQAQERIAALEAENKTLQASNVDLTNGLKDANDKLTKFSADARTAEVKQLFTDIGREFKDDDAEAKVFSAMPKEAFDATAKVMREQFKKPGIAKTSELFSHTATGGSAEATQTSQAGANPLMKDAERRAAQFSKR
jgi:hypothetical protein